MLVRILRTVVIVAVAAVVLWYAGRAIFHTGGQEPGSGEGEIVQLTP
jgi:hypothetical protein